MLRRPPRHAQKPKNLPLIPTLQQRTLRHPLSLPPAQHIRPQPALIQPHALPARQQPDAPIENVVAREIDQRGAHLRVRDEEEIDAVPDLGAREGGAAVPFGAVGAGGGGGEGVAEIVLLEEGGDHGVEDDGPQGFHAGVWFRDDEIDVAGIRGAATVGAADCDFDGGVFLVDGIADDAAVVFDFVSRNTSGEIVDVFDADFLVRRERGLCEEVVEGAVALVDPQAGLGVADAVNLEEELESDVCAVEIRVFETAETVGEDDFFNLAGKTGADEGDGESFFFGGDFTCSLFECGDSFPIGDGLPVLIGTIVVVHHLL